MDIQLLHYNEFCLSLAYLLPLFAYLSIYIYIFSSKLLYNCIYIYIYISVCLTVDHIAHKISDRHSLILLSLSLFCLSRLDFFCFLDMCSRKTPVVTLFRLQLAVKKNFVRGNWGNSLKETGEKLDRQCDKKTQLLLES